MWGADTDKSWKYGIDNNAVSCQPGYNLRFTDAFKNYIDKGFETIHNKAESLKTYSNCLEYFINRIKNKQHFAIMKCADGEYSISINKSIQVQPADDWTFKTDSILNKHFNNSLTLINSNVFYGISGPSDSKEICDYWYKNIPNTHNITYANVFVNKNYSKWEEFLKNADYNCVLISQVYPSSGKLGGMKIIDYLPIDKYLVNNWDAEYEKYFQLVSKLARDHTNVLFFISAGPLANIFVHRMYLENPNNTYIDCGSSIDFLTKGIYTRTYQTNSNECADKEKLPIVYNDLNRVILPKNNIEVIEFRLIETRDNYDMEYYDEKALTWSRIYEYPLVLEYISKLNLKNKNEIQIHNTSWGGIYDVHVKFKNKLDENYLNCLHSDIVSSKLEKTTIYDITKKSPEEFYCKFDFVINVSTIEEVDYNNWIILNNLLDQVKIGGYLIITFDLPGLQVELFEKNLNVKLKRNENALNGNNSKLKAHIFGHLNCGVLVIKKLT